MAITEYAIFVFKSPLPSRLSDSPALHDILQKLAAWQSACSGYPLRFYTNRDDPEREELHLVSGFTSLREYGAWTRTESHRELTRLFKSYPEIKDHRRFYLDLDLGVIPKEAAGNQGASGRQIVVERYQDPDGTVARTLVKESELRRSDRPASIWSLVGKGLAKEDREVFRILGFTGNGMPEVGGRESRSVVPVGRWVLERAEL